MKRTSLLLAAALVVLPAIAVAQKNSETDTKASSKAAGHVKAKYDKKKDLTTVTLKTIPLGGAMSREVTNVGETGQLDLSVYFTHPGEQLAKPAEAAMLKFKSTSKYPAYQRGQILMAVVDEDRAIPIGDTTYSTNSQTFYIEEFLTATVPYELMKRITSASKVKLFLGAREISLKQEQLEDLREITRRMAP
ncbi:MAG TPA: hypothetical protein VJU84_19050 [Pyrinomonadaceae bacterium]|nr:hypothetical protein [Pyrinomonadaceae bacterium]